jgi:phosphomannomutase
MARIGEAAGTYCPRTFTIGRDFRDHGAQLGDAFVSGLKKTGSNANLNGTCPAILCAFELENEEKRNHVHYRFSFAGGMEWH